MRPALVALSALAGPGTFALAFVVVRANGWDDPLQGPGTFPSWSVELLGAICAVMTLAFAARLLAMARHVAPRRPAAAVAAAVVGAAAGLAAWAWLHAHRAAVPDHGLAGPMSLVAVASLCLLAEGLALVAADALGGRGPTRPDPVGEPPSRRPSLP